MYFIDSICNFSLPHLIECDVSFNRKCNWVGEAIAAAGAVGSTVASGVQANNLNGRNRRWQEKMYAQQREDAVEDRDLAYQRQLLFRNDERAYNDPAAQRKRLEDAGFNPFLTGVDAGNVQGVPGVSPSGSTPSVPTPATTDAGVNAIANAGNTFASVLGSVTENALARHTADKTDAETKLAEEQARAAQTRNDTLIGGLPSTVQDAIRDYAAGKLSLEQANKVDTENCLQKLALSFYTSTAQQFDEDTQTWHDVTDETGNPISNYTYGMRADVNSRMAGYTKMLNEIRKISSEGKNIDADTLVKNYTYLHLLPAQVAELYSAVGELNSRKELNKESARVQGELVKLNSSLKEASDAKINLDKLEYDIKTEAKPDILRRYQTEGYPQGLWGSGINIPTAIDYTFKGVKKFGSIPHSSKNNKSYSPPISEYSRGVHWEKK